MNYLLLFSLSPVQSFIAQARKTQDLFGGSKILSELVRDATNVVGEENVIFPNLKVKSLPNRFIAKLENQTEAAVMEKGKALSIQVKTSWVSKINQILQEKKLTKPAGFDDQTEDFWDVNWVALPYTDETYASTFEELNVLLGEVKNIRNTEQFEYQVLKESSFGEKGRKCSIDGERNVKFYRQSDGQKTKDNLAIRNKTLFAKENEILPYEPNGGLSLKYLQPGEGLSAVSLAKRFFGDEEDNPRSYFESTADISLLRVIDYLWQNHMERYMKFCEPFRKLQSVFNAQVLFEENLTAKYFKKQGYQKLLVREGDNLIVPNSIKEERKALERLAKDAPGKYKFTKYYAVVVFDGDEMGKWMGGENLNHKDQLPTFHKALSEKLGGFANTARIIIEGKSKEKPRRGCDIYAGGDDFLGLVNINYLFPVLSELRLAFDKEVNQPLQTSFGFKRDLTFSAGVAIAHYKTPLNIVLNRARKMEEFAKSTVGRDAFAIALMKHSGESHEVGFKWMHQRTLAFNNNEAYHTNAGYLLFLSKQLRDNFSRKFLKNLDREFHLLTPEFLEKNPEMMEVELSRLLKRSCLPKSKDGKKKEAADKALQTDKVAEALSMLNSGKAEFIQTLHMLDFVHRQLDENL